MEVAAPSVVKNELYLLVRAADISAGWLSGMTSGGPEGPGWSRGVADICKELHELITIKHSNALPCSIRRYYPFFFFFLTLGCTAPDRSHWDLHYRIVSH